MGNVTTVILRKDGSHHTTIQNCSPEDARRWADEGFYVFQLAARGREWAVYMVNQEKLFSSETPPVQPDAAERSGIVVKLLTAGREP